MQDYNSKMSQNDNHYFHILGKDKNYYIIRPFVSCAEGIYFY